MRSYAAIATGGSRATIDGVAPATYVNHEWPVQSYFDSTLLENAILVQPSGSLIVPSTLNEAQLNGYAVGLHPSSQAPIAIDFRVGAGATSGVLVLRPGQIITPTGGVPGSGTPTHFSGFRYGLPYGWLGGGAVTLCVLHTPSAEVDWSGSFPEIIYHRIRVPILVPADLTAAGARNNARYNWPGRFPWAQAGFGTNKLAQGGKPILSVTPTKTLAILHGQTNNAVVADSTMRIIVQRANETVDNANTVVDTDTFAEDFTWMQWAQFGTNGNLAVQRQARFLPETSILNRVFADNGGICLVDLAGGVLKNGGEGYVDFVRYGRL